MEFQKGNKHSVGRPKGSKNRDQRSIVEIYAEVFHLMGGIPKFLEWASKNPNLFYSMHNKLAPVQIKLATDKPFEINLSLGQDAKVVCSELGLKKLSQ
jgi:dihydroorotase